MLLGDEVKGDRILASAILLVFAAAIGIGVGTFTPNPPGEFTLQDQNWLHENYPYGRYFPDREHARFFRVCLAEQWVRFWADGYKEWTGQPCWK